MIECMKKKVVIIGIIAMFFMSVALITHYMDSARVRNSVEPIFTIKIISEDGNKVTYWGLGYKVICYPSVSPKEPYENNRGVKYGSWFMNYVLPEQDIISNNIFNRVFYSDFPGVSVNVTNIVTEEDKIIMNVVWNNKTEYTITYGDMYWIERLEKDEWVDCSLNENIFPMIGYLLEKNGKENKEYILTDMHDITITGTYRFFSKYSVDTGDGKQIPCSLWTEFFVKQANFD